MVPTRRVRRLIAGAGLVIAVIVLAGCGGDSGSSMHMHSNTGEVDRTVRVRMVDSAFVPSSISVHKGETIRFVLTNRGGMTHEAVVGSHADQLAHERSMAADPGMAEVDHADSVTVAPGAVGELVHTFTAGGPTEIACHEPGHYAAGMVLRVSVKAEAEGWGKATESLKMGFFMLWETLWALILGFGLSGVVQAFVSKEQMQRVMGDHRPGTVARASFFGMVSSSCSYAATAMAKSLFQKGADFVTAMVFMFASTNLVIELGVVLLILMGWQFAAAEFIGGPIMILLFASVGGYLFHRRITDPARERLQHGVVGGHDHQAMVGVSHDRQEELEREPWRQKLTSKAAWSDAASYTMADITMLRKELVFGYLVAGILTVVVPMDAWNDLFLHGHGFWTVLENAALGPVIAFVSFVCSIGNVPLAAALWAGGISFAGVISFIFADLITFPLFLIYRKYYGTRLAVRLALTFWAVMTLAGLAVEGIFSLFGVIPEQSGDEVVHTRFEWNYTTYLNFVFLVVFAGLYWLYRNRGRFGGGDGYALDPVCGMQVRTNDAPAQTVHDGTTVHFCSDRCLDRFERDPQRYLDSPASAPHAHDHDHEEDPMAIDPICGMTVDPTNAPAMRRHADRNWFFCNPGCAETFDTDPDRYVAQAQAAGTD